MEFAAISVLVDFSIYIAPALLFRALWFLLTPAKAAGLHIVILLAGLALMRDAMTPFGDLGTQRNEADPLSTRTLWC